MADVGAQSAAPAARGASESLFDLARSVLRELPALIGDRVELLALELQRAGAALAQLVALATAAAIFALTAWLALWGVLVGLLIALGLHWAAAHAVALLVNVAAAAWTLWRVRSLARLLGLPATRRHLMIGLAVPPERAPAQTKVHDEEPAVTPGSVAAS
ncbi:MAG TPA: phage holin family protein [Burkholderiaceae bacterium]|nr:phage holin family protein [Burkholderiaceae bacterium]